VRPYPISVIQKASKMRVIQTLYSIFIALFLLTLSCGVGVLLGSTATGEDRFDNRKAVAVIRAEGPISGGEPAGFLASEGAYSDVIVKQLRRAAKNDSVKAIVLRVDSPGGGITPSDEIRNQIVKIRKETNKPVIASMGSTAASGGYYISAPANHIMANETTITGSIGVITIIPNLQGLLEKVGVSAEVLTSGPNKDLGSGLAPLSEDDRQILQAVINDAYDRFVQVVAEGRGIDPESVRKFADGRIFTAKQAKELKLIDGYGDLPEAIELAADLGGINGEPRVIDYGERGSALGLGASLFSGLVPRPLNNILDNGPIFSINYLYIGRTGSSIIMGR